MRKLLLILLVHLAITAGFSESLPLNQLGTPFQRSDLGIRWNVSSNTLPSTIWVYKVLPDGLSPSVVSNLMALGPFSDQDRTNIFLHFSDDPKRMRFALPTGKSLEIFPTIGCVEYQDSTAERMNDVEGVPQEGEMLKLTSSYLPKLGIKNSELAKKPNQSDLLTYFTFQKVILYDENNKPYTTNIYSRGVYFIRSVDRIDFLGIGGRGGCRIDMGNHGKLSKISLLWRKLEREKPYPTAKPETLIKWIREGNSVLAPLRDDIVPFEWAAIKSLTITNATPYYFGERSKSLQNKVYPFITLYGTVETGQMNIPVEINCPIIQDETGKPLK